MQLNLYLSISRSNRVGIVIAKPCQSKKLKPEKFQREIRNDPLSNYALAISLKMEKQTAKLAKLLRSILQFFVQGQKKLNKFIIPFFHSFIRCYYTV